MISVDLLKISAMLMVVFYHITTHGVRNAVITPFSIPYWFVTVINSVSIVAVNCFVLICGYFQCQKDANYRRLLRLWVQVCTYSILIYVIMCLLSDGKIVFGWKELAIHACPILSNQYWFFKYYILLLILSPWLNQFIKSLNRNSYQKMLAVLLGIFSFIPSVNILGDTFGVASGYSLIWFIILYLLGAYIRMYSYSTKHIGRIYLVLLGVICLSKIVGTTLGDSIEHLMNLQRQYNSPLVVSAAVCLMLFVTDKDLSLGIVGNNLIKSISASSFAVYLIHDHGSMADMLWNEWVCLSKYINNGGMFVFRCLITGIIIFSLGIIVEKIRVSVARNSIKVFSLLKNKK